jgi:hypothetical protein
MLPGALRQGLYFLASRPSISRQLTILHQNPRQQGLQRKAMRSAGNPTVQSVEETLLSPIT